MSEITLKQARLNLVEKQWVEIRVPFTAACYKNANTCIYGSFP